MSSAERSKKSCIFAEAISVLVGHSLSRKPAGKANSIRYWPHLALHLDLDKRRSEKSTSIGSATVRCTGTHHQTPSASDRSRPCQPIARARRSTQSSRARPHRLTIVPTRFAPDIYWIEQGRSCTLPSLVQAASAEPLPAPGRRRRGAAICLHHISAR